MEPLLPLPIPSDPAPDPRLVERYLAGECTLAEQAAMHRWIAANPAMGHALRAMRDEGTPEIQAALTPVDTRAMEQRVAEQPGATRVTGARARNVPPMSSRRNTDVRGNGTLACPSRRRVPLRSSP